MAQDDLVLSPEQMQQEFDKVAGPTGGATEASDSIPEADPNLYKSAIPEDDFEVPSWADDTFEEGVDAATDATEGDTQETEQDDVPADDEEAGNVMRVKSDGEFHDVDLGNEVELKRTLSQGLAFPRVADRLDKTLKRLEKVEARLKESDTTWDKFNKASVDKLVELRTGKSLDQIISERLDRQKAWDEATEEQRKYMKLQEVTEGAKTEYDSGKEELEELRQELTAEREEIATEKMRNQLFPEYYKYDFNKKLPDDPDLAEELNDTMWNTVVTRLDQQYGDDDELPLDAVKREFRRVAQLLDRNAEKAANRELKKISEKRRVTAKKNAQLASKRGYSQQSPEDLAKYAKDPVKLFKKMFG